MKLVLALKRTESHLPARSSTKFDFCAKMHMFSNHGPKGLLDPFITNFQLLEHNVIRWEIIILIIMSSPNKWGAQEEFKQHLFQNTVRVLVFSLVSGATVSQWCSSTDNLYPIQLKLNNNRYNYPNEIALKSKLETSADHNATLYALLYSVQQ